MAESKEQESKKKTKKTTTKTPRTRKTTSTRTKKTTSRKKPAAASAAEANAPAETPVETPVEPTQEPVVVGEDAALVAEPPAVEESAAAEASQTGDAPVEASRPDHVQDAPEEAVEPSAKTPKPAPRTEKPPTVASEPQESSRHPVKAYVDDEDAAFFEGLWPDDEAEFALPASSAKPKAEPAVSDESPEQLPEQFEESSHPQDEAPAETESAEEFLEVTANEAAPLDESAAPVETSQNGRRRRRRRGRRGRGRDREQDGNGQPAEQAARSERKGAPPAEVEQSSKPSGQRDRREGTDQRDRRDRGRDDQRNRQGRDQRAQRDSHDRRPMRPHRDLAPVPEPDEDVKEVLGSGERTMLINVAEGEECRIAILHQGRLEELFMERASTGSHVGNIYKGRVTNVEPSIQAAFIDFGMPKNGFLHISDLQPQYFPEGMRQIEEVGRKTPRRERPPIQKCLRRGQEVLVQIIKEGIGTKGPTLTTYISIPGRFLVMLPGMNRLGVSRKIEDEEVRRKMRRILDELDLPKDMGFILRTAGLDCNKRELQRDLQYLQRLWKVVANRIKHDRAPCELYQESDLVIRTVRDVFSSEFGKIIVDDEATAEKIRDFISIVMPRGTSPVEVYSGPEPLFHKYRIEEEIVRINARHVPLPSGGSLVVDSTEALVAIDVNSGRYRDLEDAEETAYRINLEAAEEIARQLRLRDLGGLIVCDFIDMRMEKHRRAVERALRDALKKHKERAKCLRMSQFGIIEMTRQRMRPSIKRSIYQDCPHCRGSGLVKNPESMTLDIMRLLRLTAHRDQVQAVEVRVAPGVAHQLLNRKRAAIHALEQSAGRQIVIRADSNLGLDQYLFECFDARGGVVEVIEPPVDAKAGSDLRSKRNALSSESRELREVFEEVFD